LTVPPGAYGSLPPRRADQQQPPDSAGLAPGASPVGFFVRVIIAGPGAGLFVYNGPGKLGNPPILSITNSTTDPYGNTITPSLTLAGLPFLVYSGPPAAGNLFLSATEADGVDSFGNDYQTGYQIHGAGQSNIEMTVISGVPRLFFSTGVPEESTSAVIEAQVINPGASEQIIQYLAGPRIALGLASYVVTATASGTHSVNGIGMDVKVLTGQAAVQNGAAVNLVPANPPQVPITPHATGSIVYGALANITGANIVPYTPNAATTFELNDAETVVTNVTYATFRGTSVTTAAVPVTVGGTAPLANSRMCAAEILALAGGPGLNEDASSPALPAVVTGAKTISTASFTPPAGSLLVAQVSSAYDGSGNPITMTVSSTGGLTWTELSADPVGATSVWIAAVPPASNASYVFAYLEGEAKDASIPASGALLYTDASGVVHGLFGWGATGVNVATLAGWSGYADITLPAEIAQHNFTTLAFVAISTAVTIPAGDAQAGTTYRHTFHGNATMSNPASAVAMQALIGGVAAAEATLPANTVAAGATFGWKAILEITIYSTGAGGSCGVSLHLTAGGANVTAQSAYGQSITIAFNTTIANNYQLEAEWVTTAGVGATRDNYPERLGP
jgi:hypothetical protein